MLFVYFQTGNQLEWMAKNIYFYNKQIIYTFTFIFNSSTAKQYGFISNKKHIIGGSDGA